MAKAKNNLDAEWQRICTAMTHDSVRVKVPRAFLSALTLFFHHVSDAMAGDDRPDHGLAKMRQGREHYRTPFYFLYGKLQKAEQKMRGSERRKVFQLFHRYHELLNERERRFREKLKSSRKPKKFFKKKGTP